jgi:hypothetical protein
MDNDPLGLLDEIKDLENLFTEGLRGWAEKLTNILKAASPETNVVSSGGSEVVIETNASNKDVDNALDKNPPLGL